MKFNRIYIAALSLLLVFGCADENLEPILTFDNAGKGAYIKLISQSSKLINVLNESTVNSSSYTYGVEFIDLENGNLVTEYKLDLIFKPVTGPSVTISNFRTFDASEFTESENGNKAIEEITITAPEILTALNLSFADLSPGDQFSFKGYITLIDNRVFGYDNSSAAVRGTAFGSHFDFTIPASCPSDLAGTFSYTGTDFWCGGSGNGSVDIIAMGGGVYRFSDWSFGAYGSCYGGGEANSTSLTFTDVCNTIRFSGFVDAYGDTWTFTSTIVADEWTIAWVNTYGESGKAILKYPSGPWPISF